MGDLYNNPWVVKRKDVLGGDGEVVYSASSFPRARDESLRLNTEAGTVDRYFIVPADVKKP